MIPKDFNHFIDSLSIMMNSSDFESVFVIILSHHELIIEMKHQVFSLDATFFLFEVVL